MTMKTELSARQQRINNDTGLRRGGWQKGCLIVFVVVLVIAIGLGVTAALTWKRLFSAGVTAGVTQVVNTSQLPQDQKDRILTKVTTVTDDFKAGKVSMQQFGRVFESVFEGPLMPLTMMMAVEEKYFKKSGLNEQDKSDAKVAINRFARGVADGKLKFNDLMASMDPLSTKSSNTTTSVGSGGAAVVSSSNNFQLKPTVTDEELRTFIADVKAKADKAEVPAEVVPINIAEEIEKSIDAGLAKGK